MIELLFCLHLQTLSCRWITGSSHNSPGHSQSSSPVHTPNPHGQRYNTLCSTVTSSHAAVCCVLTFKTEVLTAKKCPIYLFFLAALIQMWGGGEWELHWNTSGRRHLLYVSQHAKGWIQTFFFCPQQKPGPVQLSALHSSTNAEVFFISWKSAEKCHGNLVIFYLFIIWRSSV